MKIFLYTMILLLALGLMMPGVAAKKNECTTIQSGELLASDDSVIETGFDDWGYNYQARLFNGLYCDSYRDAVWCQPYKDIKLSMKWNDAWMSNKDCDGDDLLDRHNGYVTYIGSGAWLTNHQSGEYEGDEGKTCKWNYFVKIVAAPGTAHIEDGVWYTEDDTEIGPAIWGAFAIIQEVENDRCAGIHGLQYISPTRAGLGNWVTDQFVFVETVEVPADSALGVDSVNVLDSTKNYRFTASGTAFAGDTIDFDAKYSLTNRITSDTWTDTVSGYVSYGPTLLDLFVDGSSANWGVYTVLHTYDYEMAGLDSTVNFRIYDVYYPNNVGSLTVDIYEKLW